MLELKLLGKPEVLRDGVPVTASVAAKPKALLAYLAVIARPVSRDVLANLLWGESNQADAAASLRQTLATLRKLGLDTWIEATRDAVKFNLDAPHAIDTQRFDISQATLGRDWRLADANAISNLQSLISLYRGDFLEGFNLKDAPEFDEWAVTQREHYRELALRLLQTLAESALREGRYTEGVDYTRRTLALDAWREEAHRLLMLCYARSGQRSAALVQYAECRRVLDKELGVPPSAETMALYERIRAAAQTARNNLPPQVTPFVGRASQLAQIESLLLKPDCRLLTVLGIGGVGKTRLALQAASRCTERFINGVWLVPLTVVNAGSLISTIADAIQCPIRGPQEPKQQLLDFLRSRELLLLLDNAEGLPDLASLFAEMLRHAPDVKLLVTSRERLDLQSEWVFELEGLDVPTQGREDATYSAVQLFMQGAQRVRTSFALAEKDLLAVGCICRLVEGLPLGIELASAWVRTLDCAHIADEIQRNLDFLATTQRDVTEGQRSLRAVFDSSHRRLSQAEQDTFAQLSVFQGGFAEEAASAVIAGSTRSVLISLIDKSLLRRSAAGRYDLHELVRQYAASQLTAAQAEAVLERHAIYFAHFLAAHQPLLRTRREREAVEAMRADADNLRLMWRTVVQLARLDLLDQALIGIFSLHDILGWYEEGMVLFAQAIQGMESQPDGVAVQARAMTRRASLARSVGRYDEAERGFTEGLALARAAGDESNQAYALRQLGYFPMVRGDLPGALTSLNAALNLYRALNDLPRIADSLMSIGICQSRLGQLDQATVLFQEAADIMAEVGDEVGFSIAQDNLGDAACFHGQFEEALRYYKVAADVQRRYDERRNLAISQNNAADVLCRLQRWDAALVAAQESADLFREMASRDGVMHALHSQAMAWLGTGEIARASECFGEVLALGTQLHAEADLLNLLVLGGQILAARGRQDVAVRLLSAIQCNPASAAFTVEAAASALRELPEVAKTNAAMLSAWTTSQGVEAMQREFGLVQLPKVAKVTQQTNSVESSRLG